MIFVNNKIYIKKNVSCYLIFAPLYGKTKNHRSYVFFSTFYLVAMLRYLIILLCIMVSVARNNQGTVTKDYNLLTKKPSRLQKIIVVSSPKPYLF